MMSALVPFFSTTNTGWSTACVLFSATRRLHNAGHLCALTLDKYSIAPATMSSSLIWGFRGFATKAAGGELCCGGDGDWVLQQVHGNATRLVRGVIDVQHLEADAGHIHMKSMESRNSSCLARTFLFRRIA